MTDEDKLYTQTFGFECMEGDRINFYIRNSGDGTKPQAEFDLTREGAIDFAHLILCRLVPGQHKPTTKFFKEIKND